MRRAASGATRALLRRFPDEAARGVRVFVGPGNNGGDGWLVAGELARAGHPAVVVETEESRTPDTRFARAEVRPLVSLGAVALAATEAAPALVVDALLGTGARGAPRGAIAAAAAAIRGHGAAGAKVVALDLPTGTDATTGDAEVGVRADLTISFGTVKRGHLVARSRCGEIVVVDIGVAEFSEKLPPTAPRLIDADWVAAHVPSIAADAHKGTRRRLLIVGGAQGMAGAVALAARAAFRSAVGMVRVCVELESVVPLQASVSEATAVPWPRDEGGELDSLLEWPHALLLGPGLGDSPGARARVERWLAHWRGPVVVDADALNVFAGDAASLGDFLRGRPAVVTPHPVEMARLTGLDVRDVLAGRYEIGAELAQTLNASVLLKGVPTVISAPSKISLVSASGTPALATAGSGDVLGGIVATLVAQMEDAQDAAACGAWVHGRAAEIANSGRPVRGVTLTDVLDGLPDAWRCSAPSVSEGELARLPRIAEA